MLAERARRRGRLRADHPHAAVRAARATVPRDMTFVLDVSGSMRGRKMEQARAAGRQLLGTLTSAGSLPDHRLLDRRAHLPRRLRERHAGEPRRGARSTSTSSRPPAERTSPARSTRALAAALREGDGTVRARPRATGCARLPLVLFVTDGEPTVGERDPAAIAAHAARLRGDARVFTFGLGADVNARSRAARARGTRHRAVRAPRGRCRARGGAGRVAAHEPDRDRCARDVQCRGEVVRAALARAPDGPVDLFAGQDLVLLARYHGSGAARLTLRWPQRQGPVHWETQRRLPERDRGNAFVPRLWATQRIGWLTAERRRNGASPGARRRAAHARRALWHSDRAHVISRAGAADGDASRQW